MSRPRFPLISERYRAYRIMLKALKECDPVIEATRPEDGRCTAIARRSLSFCRQRGIELNVIVSLALRGGYKFKIFVEEFGPAPVFRFDSQGGGHFNPENGLGLPSRLIPTPHFHKVGPDGVEYAFRTPLLELDDQERLIRDDYSFGFTHFCQEAAICDPNGEGPAVRLLRDDLALSTENDPLADVNFPMPCDEN